MHHLVRNFGIKLIYILFLLPIGADLLVIAEGPETAASLVDAVFAVKNKTPILASLSLGNMQNMKNLIADQEHWVVMICIEPRSFQNKSIDTLSYLCQT